MASFLNNVVSGIAGEKRYWTHWQWNKAVFSEAIFKFFVSFITLLPVIVKIFQQPLPKNSTLGAETQLQHVFSWGFLWFAAVTYLIAYALYGLFCPKFIRTYNNYKDYSEFKHSPRWIVWLSEEAVNNTEQAKMFIDRMVEKRYFTLSPSHPSVASSKVEVHHMQTVLTFQYLGTQYTFGMPILGSNGEVDKDATAIAEQEVFWEIFGRFSSTKKVVRVIITVLLLISFALFCCVIVQYFIAMWKLVF